MGFINTTTQSLTFQLHTIATAPTHRRRLLYKAATVTFTCAHTTPAITIKKKRVRDRKTYFYSVLLTRKCKLKRRIYIQLLRISHLVFCMSPQECGSL